MSEQNFPGNAELQLGIKPLRKSFTGCLAMKNSAELGLGVPGKSLWMPEYWDRYIRNEEHLHKVIEYIHQNPVKAHLCQFPELWRWSSARERRAPALQSSPTSCSEFPNI